MPDGELVKIKLICHSCGYRAGECNAYVRDFLCRFCIEERDFFIEVFTNQFCGNQYETLAPGTDPDWERHRNMMETKQKVNQLFLNCNGE